MACHLPASLCILGASLRFLHLRIIKVLLNLDSEFLWERGENQLTEEKLWQYRRDRERRDKERAKERAPSCLTCQNIPLCYVSTFPALLNFSHQPTAVLVSPSLLKSQHQPVLQVVSRISNLEPVSSLTANWLHSPCWLWLWAVSKGFTWGWRLSCRLTHLRGYSQASVSSLTDWHTVPHRVEWSVQPHTAQLTASQEMRHGGDTKSIRPGDGSLL